MIDQNKLQKVKQFFEDRIVGWMIADLKRSIDAETNFLTALGCLVYTEVIGTFLPVLEKEKGRIGERRFYRCLFRLPSTVALRELDNFLYKETNKGIYAHLRNTMTHKYFPIVSKRRGDVVLFLPSMVARNGFMIDRNSGERQRSSPMFIDDKDKLIIATRNYVDELDRAVGYFFNETFINNNDDFQKSTINGLDTILWGKS